MFNVSGFPEIESKFKLETKNLKQKMKLNTDFSNFPILTTENLILREVNEKDVDEVFFLRSDLEIMKYIPREPAKTKQNALDHIDVLRKNKENQDGINWAITQKGDDTLIGIIGLYRINKTDFRAEVGYILHPKFHGKGYIKESIEKIIDFAFNHVNFHTLTAIIDARNTASENVLKKANFTKEAHFREDCYHNGEFSDSIHYSMKNPQH